MVLEIRRVNYLTNLIKYTERKYPLLKENFRQLKPLLRNHCILVLTCQQKVEDCHDLKSEQDFKEQRKATMKKMYISILVLKLSSFMGNANFNVHISELNSEN